MSTHAIAIVHEEAGVYGITFPDLPGCVAAGESLDEVLQRGVAAAAHVGASALHLENFLYFSRCGMIESVPSRRILSFS